ncbi:MAG TPA: multicopper oxidase domain-containing protein [Candidatus Acidoferrales bacterium]|jgi:FtsP/CotA-like multicopper oxidase with cupredoxin domain|nr:multicopper oxidase domain-containing protein [Candidatus Acidoferrales bacterium]
MSRGHFFLPWNASKARLREAENARKNRLEIVKAVSQGAVSRRELFKWGVITGAGLLAPIHGLNPFVRSAYADGGGGIPTGTPPSPGTVGLDFSQPMPPFEVLPRIPYSKLNPVPTVEANTTQMPVSPLLGGYTGPIEGRPPGPDWAHQRWDEFLPKVAFEVTQEGAKTNPNGNIPFTFYNSLSNPSKSLPAQNVNSMWTFNGTVPPKLVQGRYGEPLLLRHHNNLPADVTKNNGFGRHTITTHEHNGHHGAENDGFGNAFFFPGQFYDYHWPIILAGHDSINTNATDPRAGGPDDNFGVNKVPGDWHETMSTHWFHDHMFAFTSQNVYKGNAAMFNIYSALDRGNETVKDGVNLQLPSGTDKSWGNLEYDINLVLADKAWDAEGQLYFDIFNFDGFLGDAITVNFAYKPYFEVEARRYRFRILNGSVARFFKLALSDGSPMMQIANDGNLMPHPVTQTQLDEQGIGERFDIIIDFSRYKPTPTNPNPKVWMVNLCEHEDGKGPKDDLSLAQALSGKSSDPGVGSFLEFRVIPMKSGTTDTSKPLTDADTLIPNPDLSKIKVARERTFEFGRSGGTDAAPWTIKTDGGQGLAADLRHVSAAPKEGTLEIWHMNNGGGGWDHPVHVHFEESQLLARNGSFSNVPLWERGRKDVYRLHPGGNITIAMQFREFAGMFMEHCHNTTHEDHAMLLRFEVGQGLVPMPTPCPTPQGVKYVSTTVEPGAFTP